MMLKSKFVNFFIFIFIFSFLSSCIVTDLSDDYRGNIVDNQIRVINYSSLSLEQKVSQMFMVHDLDDNIDVYKVEGFGGVFIWKRSNYSDYVRVINLYQSNMTIPFLFAVDFEGCINPFDSFYNSSSLVNISTDLDAYRLGLEHGKILFDLGINLNFAPVADVNDTIWNCRSFNPNFNYSTSSLVKNYILGLQSVSVGATVKHYPGKTLIGFDPHKVSSVVNLTYDDVLPFMVAMKNNVSAVMISHKIVSGYLDSKDVPVVVSDLIVDIKENYSGLIITDDVKMGALYDFYGVDNFDRMFIDLVNFGNDIILYSDFNVSNVVRARDVIVSAVNKGLINETRIDESVLKILKFKGFKVIY